MKVESKKVHIGRCFGSFVIIDCADLVTAVWNVKAAVLRLHGRKGSKHLKVTILDYHIDRAKTVEAAEEKVKCQLTKYQLCMGCRACEGVCRHGAIRLESMPDGGSRYHIDDYKCIRCAQCVNHFNSGCYMKKVLAVKRG